VTLSNTGGGPLTITSIATTGTYSQTNTCGASVAAGASCAISVAFTPTATGTLTGTVVITDNAANSPQMVALTGTGAAATVAFAPGSLTFANQTVNTSSPAQTVTLTNNTGVKLTITSIAASANYSQTNTCGASVNAGASCTINATFTPTTTGVLPGTVTIADSATNSPQTVPLTGTGVAAGIGFSPTSVTFANQSVGTSSPASAVTLTNSGTAALTITSITISGTNAGDFSETNTCGTSVAAGASCTINAVFTPTASGARTANVSVADSATGSPQLVPLSGTGTAPGITLSPTSITFASVPVGQSSAASPLTLSNSGTAALTINSVSVTGANAGDFSQTNNCGSSLAVGTSCTINVTFTPTASGTRQASVSVSDNAAGSPQTAALTGTGTAPSVSFSTSSVNFPNESVGASSPVSGITLFNIGNATLTISSIAITGADPGDFSQTNTCGSSVAAGGNCTISVIFTPTVAGVRTASISVSDNAGGSPQTVALTGTGTTGGAVASISPSSLTFASQNVLSTSAPQTITLTNTGGAALSIISIVASGDYAQTNACGSSLAAGAKCTVQVTFSPSFTGTRTGYVTFSDNDPSAQQAVTLTGTGAQPTTTVSIVPMQSSVTPGQTMQFTASISGVTSSSVTWTVDSIAGGNSTVGTISSSGLYTAPSAAGSHVVAATSTANKSEAASVPIFVTSYAGTFVYHNDNARTGQNLTETVLTTGNVNTTQFGKVFSDPVDGQIYAEPLYVQGVSIAGQGVHNVVYVATENDSVYAFDADGLTTTPLWQVNFLTNGAQTLNTTDIGGCANITPQVGITSTPVIDPVSNTIFVLARTKIVSGSNTTYYQTLHALDITTGQETPGSPVVIQATANSKSGTITFNPQTQNQRAGLFIDNGVVYIGWASHCDIQPYHGWLIGYQEGTLQQVAVFNTSPNGVEGGIWQSGAAPAVDENGDIFVSLGNGTMDVSTGGVDYGEGLLNLSPGSLTVNDYFIPSNYQTLNNSDLDLGSGGPLLLPTQPTSPTELLVAAGKQGMVYLADRTNLGGYNSGGNQVVQTLPAGTVPTAHSSPAYWQNNIYFCGVGDYAKSFLLSNGLLSNSPTSESANSFGYPGATPAVSANGGANGILWVMNTVQNFPAQLYAYDATNLSRNIYNTAQNSRDKAGIAVKFAVPTVANGKVYVGTSTELDVYGLLPQP
ncbi:MAG: choice-of-anchor D domain-containing protein, partial [Candidatus Sulfotelmatobacter sp.]